MAYGGHEEKFVDPVMEFFICSICDLPLRDAVQTDECGHRFCFSCLERYRKTQEERYISIVEEDFECGKCHKSLCDVYSFSH